MSGNNNWIKVNIVFSTMGGNVVDQRTAQFGSDDTDFEYDGLFFANLNNVFSNQMVTINDFIDILVKIYPDEYVDIAQKEFIGLDWNNVCSVSISDWIGEGSDVLDAIGDDLDDVELMYNARGVCAIWHACWNKWHFERYVETDDGYDRRIYQENSVKIQN